MRATNDRAISAENDHIQREKLRYTEELQILINNYALHCARHGIVPSTNQPARIPDYTAKANRLRWGTWAGMILATVVFALLNVVSLDAGLSPTQLFVASIIFALFIGYLASCTVARLAHVDVMEPRSVTRADYALIVGGIAAIASLASFLYLRFTDNAIARSTLPMIAMIFELGTLVFVAAAREILPVYSWPEELTAKYDRSEHEIQILDARITACTIHLNKENNHHDDHHSPVPAGTPLYDSTLVRKPNGTATGHPGMD